MATTHTSAIFRSATAASAIRPLIEQVKYARVPIGNCPKEEVEHTRAAVAMSLIRYQQTKEGTQPSEEAMSYILTVTNLLFPELVDTLQANKCANFAPGSFSFDLGQVFNTFETDEEEDEKSSKLVTFRIPDLDFDITDLDWEVTHQEVSARWGIEMFPIGKNVSPQNLSAFRVKRVNALKHVLQITGDECIAFVEESLPTLNILASIEKAFNEYKAIRAHYANYWIAMLTNGADSRGADAFLVTFRLTDGYGMSAPCFILDLVFAHPHLIEFPALKPDITRFLLSVKAFSQMKASDRGFIKVVAGSSHRLFSQSARGSLLAIATEYRALIEPSARNFMDTTPYLPLLANANEFLKKAGFEPITGDDRMTAQSASLEEA